MRKFVRSVSLSSLTMNEYMPCTAQGAKIKYYDTMKPREVSIQNANHLIWSYILSKRSHNILGRFQFVL